MAKKRIQIVLLAGAVTVLSACSSFTGIRTPRYDGKPFETQPEKIAAYDNGQEIIGEEKEFYIPEPFSEDILNPSLDYIEHEPILLEEGTYVVGEDIPAGRVSLFGEKEDPSLVISGFDDPNAPPKPEEYKVGTMTIRDAEGKLYFENMFHPFYGVKYSQVDFIEGHTIELYGNKPEVVVFFDEQLPDDPYVFDTRWEDFLAESEGQEGYVEVESFEGVEKPSYEQEQPIKILEEEAVELKSGIYEVGKHFPAGTYEITEQAAPTHTELFLFRESEEPRVFEINKNLTGITEGWVTVNEGTIEPSAIELLPGDKLYPHYVNYLKLTKIE